MYIVVCLFLILPQLKLNNALGKASPSYEDLEQPDEGWLAECFNDAEMHLSPDNLYASSDFCVQIIVNYTS